MSNLTKKKKITLYMYLFLAVLYIVASLYVIHVAIAMEEGFAFDAALTEGAILLFLNPFAIFPIPGGAFAIISLVTIFGVLLIGGSYAQAKKRKHDDPNTVYGDAKWLDDLEEYNRKYTEPLGKPTNDGDHNIILSQDIKLSLDSQAIGRNAHVLVIGGSGSGKSYNYVGPNLLEASKNTSYVVTDPSGGLYRTYGHYLEHKGYKVRCFNLDRMTSSCHYNPFKYIHSDKDVEILVNTLITSTTPPDAKGGDPFWTKSETALLCAIIGYLHHHVAEPFQTFGSVMKMIRLAQVNENDSSAVSPLDVLFDEVKAETPDAFEVKQYSTFRLGAGRTLKSILISVAVRLQAFDLDDVAELTKKDDIDLDSIGDERTALFIILPTGNSAFNFLASLMYSQMFERVYDYAQNTAAFSQLLVDSDGNIIKTLRAGSPEDAKKSALEGQALLERIRTTGEVKWNSTYQWFEIRTERNELIAFGGTEDDVRMKLWKIQNGRIMPNSEQSSKGERLPVHTRFIMDEWANTSALNGFQEVLSTSRKFCLSIDIIVQSLTQIKERYPTNYQNVAGNTDSLLYLGGGVDLETAKFISDALGKSTRTVMNLSYSDKSGNTSLNRAAVELLSPAQLRTLPEDECIVMIKGLCAYKGKKYRTDMHPQRELMQALNGRKGEYFFSPRKIDSLSKEGRAEDADVIAKHGKVEDFDAESIMRRNALSKQRASEMKANKDATGAPIVSPSANVDGKDGASATTSSGEFNLEDTMKANERLWGEEHILYDAKSKIA